jgi:spore germination protein KB
MEENKLSSRAATCLMTMLIVGSNLIFGVSSDKQNDQWISLILSLVFSIPFILMYTRIVKLANGRNIFEVINDLFGKFFGKILLAGVAFFGFFSAARLLREFSDFINLTALKKTPISIIILVIALVCLYLAKARISVLGKFSFIAFIVGYGADILISLLGISSMKPGNLLPIVSQSLGETVLNTLNSASLSALEIVYGFALVDTFSRKNNIKKIYFSSLILGYFLVLLVFFRTIMILGPESASIFYFPRFAAIRVISTGQFLERIEKFSYFSFLLFGVVKIVIFLYASCRALATIFNIKEYEKLMLPTTFLMLSTCVILSDNIMRVFAFFPIFYIYSLPFQIIVPLIMWIFSEIKAWRSRKMGKEVAI